MCESPDGSARIAALSADQCSPSTAITRCPTMRAKRPDRQAALGAGLPVGAGATTVNKMCGSGMKAVMLAHDQILAGSADVIVAGGMESMSNAPYLLERARSGYRMGHGQVVDHMFFDGLEDAYDKGRLMGTFAEQCATSYQFTREAQDAFAATSLTRAKRFATHNRPVSPGHRCPRRTKSPPYRRPSGHPNLQEEPSKRSALMIWEVKCF